jgi:hypothetical protein
MGEVCGLDGLKIGCDGLETVWMHLNEFSFWLVLPDWWRGECIVTAPTPVPRWVSLQLKSSIKIDSIHLSY